MTAPAPWVVSSLAQPTQIVATIAALRANLIAYTNIYVQGYTTPHDGGEGLFVLNSADTTSADDGGMVIVDAVRNRYYRSVPDGVVSIRYYGASPSASALTNRQAAQAATRYLKTAGGGVLYIPPGTYQWNAAQPVVIPSNVTVQGDRSSSLIVPDISTVVDSGGITFPTASIGLFCTGDPAANTRAGVTHSGTFNGHSGTYVDSSTVVSNVHFDGIRIESSYAGPQLTGTKYLQGIMCIFCHTGSVTNCTVKGLPSNGINVAWGRDIIVRGCVTETCGFWAPYPSACNGIHASGWFDPSDAAQSSWGLIIEGNHSSYNRDEGIQHGLWQGTVIRGNVCIGNGDKGIEGDSGLAFANTSTYYNQVVPGDCIVEGNYIDGTIPSWIPAKPWGADYTGLGIGAADANQNKIIVKGNVVKNIAINSLGANASGIGISVTQPNNYDVVIEGNVVDGVLSNSGTAVGSGIIVAIGESILVTGNVITNLGLYVTGINTSGWSSNLATTITNNTVDTGQRALLVNVGMGPSSGGATLPHVTIEGNRFTSARREHIRITFGATVNLRALRIANNLMLRGNLGSGNEGGSQVAIALGISGAFTPTIAELWIAGNEVTSGALYDYLMGTPFTPGWTAFPSGTITKAVLRNNSLGSYNFTPGYIDTAAIITTLLDDPSNGLAGQRSMTGTAAPASGTWSVGDRLWNSAPSSGNPLVWVCTTAGTPGTWTALTLN